MVVPFPVVFCTTITLGLEVIGIVVILVVVPYRMGEKRRPELKTSDYLIITVYIVHNLHK